MGKDCYCDLCGGDVATIDSLAPIRIGDQVEAEACFTCAGALTTSLTKTRAEVMAARKAAPAPVPPAPVPPPPGEAVAPIPGPVPTATQVLQAKQAADAANQAANIQPTVVSTDGSA